MELIHFHRLSSTILVKPATRLISLRNTQKIDEYYISSNFCIKNSSHVTNLNEMDRCDNLMATGRLVCPKPRRVGPSNLSNSVMPLRFPLRGNGAEAFDSKAGAELLDLTPCKEGFQGEGCPTVSSSPPFSFGSPPCRAQNPLAQDAYFRVQKHGPTVSFPYDSVSLPSVHSRVKVGSKQAAERVEGFDSKSRASAVA